MEQTPLHGDDQQVRRSFDLGYLAGIIDGEGSVMMIQQREKRNRYIKANGEVSVYDGRFFTPSVTISNTNPGIIENIHQAMTRLGIPHHIQAEHPDYRERGWKVSTKIVTRGWKRVKRLIELLTPVYMEKGKQLGLLSQLISLRFSRERWGEGYRQDEMALIQAIKKLNEKGSKPQRPEVLPAQSGRMLESKLN